MKIEILYPQVCCLYGDKGNTMFLRQCLPDAEFVYTTLNDRPLFLSEEVDLCCMYSMSEQSQEQILTRLMQWKEEINQRCHEGKTLFLLLGNAMELFGSYIEKEDGNRIEALGTFDTHAVRQAPNRFNSLIQASFKNMELLGYTSRFSHTYGITEEMSLAKVSIGTGSNPETKLEGIRSGRVIGTYLLGPLLVSNPDFSKWLLGELGVPNPVLPFEDALYQSYHVRQKEFKKPDLKLE